MGNKEKGRLVLKDGSVYEGILVNSGKLPLRGEVVFNTSMTGYQEILTDPSYAGQIIVMTYPQIGNYGAVAGDFECEKSAAAGLVVKELSPFFSRAPGRYSLEAFLKEQDITCLAEIDTRAVTRKIRSSGAVGGAIGGRDAGVSCLQAEAASAEGDSNLVSSVSGRARGRHCRGRKAAIIDLGVKKSIIDSIAGFGIDTYVMRSDFKADEIISGDYEFLVLSNGPGDPVQVPQVIREVRKLLGKIPMLGICLGHQVAALALGGGTYKLKFGHRGANQPVICRRSGRVFITSQNHGYAVSGDIADVSGVQITHTNANDGTIEGFSVDRLGIKCVQFHPEASPGPRDTGFIFDEFSRIAEAWQESKNICAQA